MCTVFFGGKLNQAMAIMRINWLDPAPPPDKNTPEPPLLKRLAWFAGISLASVCVVASIAYILRGLLLI